MLPPPKSRFADLREGDRCPKCRDGSAGTLTLMQVDTGGPIVLACDRREREHYRDANAEEQLLFRRRTPAAIV